MQEDKQRGRARPMQKKREKHNKRGKASEEKKESKEVMHSKKTSARADVRDGDRGCAPSQATQLASWPYDGVHGPAFTRPRA